MTLTQQVTKSTSSLGLDGAVYVKSLVTFFVTSVFRWDQPSCATVYGMVVFITHSSNWRCATLDRAVN